MRIIRASDCKPTPWKNGGGSTTEIAIGPAGASFDDFDWRVSMATVASDGPFSNFPGVDRTLAVIKGGGLSSTMGGDTPVTLGTEAAPVSFPGDTPTSARLTAGEITDLNVMTRRGRFRHRLVRISTSMPCDFGDNDIVVVLSLDDRTSVAFGGERATLDRGDAALIGRTPETDLRISPATNRCYLIWLRERRT